MRKDIGPTLSGQHRKAPLHTRLTRAMHLIQPGRQGPARQRHLETFTVTRKVSPVPPFFIPVDRTLQNRPNVRLLFLLVQMFFFFWPAFSTFWPQMLLFWPDCLFLARPPLFLARPPLFLARPPSLFFATPPFLFGLFSYLFTWLPGEAFLQTRLRGADPPPTLPGCLP